MGARVPTVQVVHPRTSCLVFLSYHNVNISRGRLISFFISNTRLTLGSNTVFNGRNRKFVQLGITYPQDILERTLSRVGRTCRLGRSAVTWFIRFVWGSFRSRGG